MPQSRPRNNIEEQSPLDLNTAMHSILGRLLLGSGSPSSYGTLYETWEGSSSQSIAVGELSLRKPS